MNERRTGARLVAVPLAGVPSQDGLRLILAGTAYLVVICLLQLSVVAGSASGHVGLLPRDVVEVRDVVALFGWVGLMITGVSVIIVPNHLRVHLRPAYLPRVHLVGSNVGLGVYLLAAMASLGPAVADAGLLVTSASFLGFGLGVIATVLPFARHPLALPPLRSVVASPSEGRR